ncbi:LLM class flavin-dependent oxidoreductase [Marinomonas epiphytica]
MLPLSLLDLAPIAEQQSVAQALTMSRNMAQAAEQSGFLRYWLAEHHGMAAVASSATAVLLSHIGAATSKIRIGSGGIMLPNHSPLVIAEQFGTLAELYPNRVDLGLGRAPGTDMQTARALRRNMHESVDQYPSDVKLLQNLLSSGTGQEVLAIPGKGTNVPLWMLGSSLFSAQLAAQMSLPYSFASHFAPDQLLQALTLYRRYFEPSEAMPKSRAMAGVMAVVAQTDEEAQFLFTSSQQQFINLRRGYNRPFPKPVESMESIWSPSEKHIVEHTLQYALVGSKASVKFKLERFLEQTQVDELIVSMPIHDGAKRLESVKLLGQLMQEIN